MTQTSAARMIGAVDLPVTDIDPQPGSQRAFLKTKADIAVYGGAAGAGKSFALLMEALRHVHRPGYGAVIFRRTYPQIASEGGLWDTSMQYYRAVGGIPKQSTLEWNFPAAGTRIKFAHMQHEKDRHDWDGAQIALIGFDQLEHFSWKQFFYMLARNRSTCGIRPYIRATANPDPDHWLRRFMAWWIDEDSGLPIAERGGVLRWFIAQGDNIVWAAQSDGLANPKSFTFIPGKVFDNKILLQQNPDYLANLLALPRIDRGRLLDGNWNIRESAGMFFDREWFEIVPAAPALIDTVRYWDRAATPAKADRPSDASWTAGVCMGVDSRGVYYITDVVRFQGSPLTVETRIKNVASQDSDRVRIGIEQDPGQAGKAEAEQQVRNLAGYDALINTVHEAKGIRARKPSAQAEAGNIKLVRGPWNEDYLREVENFDGSRECVSDQTDATSGAFLLLTKKKRAGVWGR